MLTVCTYYVLVRSDLLWDCIAFFKYKLFQQFSTCQKIACFVCFLRVRDGLFINLTLLKRSMDQAAIWGPSSSPRREGAGKVSHVDL